MGKWLASALAVFGLLLASPAVAQSTATPVLPGALSTTGCAPGFTVCWTQITPVLVSTGFQQVSVTNGAAVGFTPGAGSQMCVIQTETQSVRFRTDNVAPTTSVGQLIGTGQVWQFTANLSGVKFIATAGTATLDVDCFK